MTYKNLFSCDDKVALVTGGAGLIGKEVVKGLHEFGAKVYVADISEEGISAICDNIKVKYIYCDITSEDSVRDVIRNITENDKSLDILVNCSYPRTADWGLKLENVPFSSWKENLDTHLGGYFLSSRMVAEEMKKQSGGSIINFASTYGVVGPDFSIYEGTEMTMSAAYSAIKGGIITFTKYLATYYAKYNIRANAISPGGIFDKQPAPFVEKYSQKTPLGRMGYPGEIVGTVIYLASESASYVTGQNLMVDGGWTAW